MHTAEFQTIIPQYFYPLLQYMSYSVEHKYVHTMHYLTKSSNVRHTKRDLVFFFVGWELRHQVLRPLLAYCTAPDDR
jgi:hypothetical protein